MIVSADVDLDIGRSTRDIKQPDSGSATRETVFTLIRRIIRSRRRGGKTTDLSLKAFGGSLGSLNGLGVQQRSQVDFLVLDSQLDADMMSVGEDGALGKVQQLGDFFVYLSVADKLGHLQLRGRELVGQR